MTIAVLGVGGVGGYFGGRLAQAGEKVAFIARGEHLAAIRAEGLRIVSPKGDAHLVSVQATDDPASIGPVDTVIVAVKAWQLPEAVSQLKPLLTEHTTVLPLLNGIEAPEIIGEAIGKSHVLGGLCGIVAYIEAPGLIRHLGITPYIHLGELDNSSSSRVDTLTHAFEKAGVTCRAPDDIQLAMWKKFLFIASVSGVTAVARATLGEVRALPETRQLIRLAMDEIVAVGQSEGVDLTVADIDKTLELLDASPADGTTSLQRDVQGGRRSELHSQTGAVVRLAKKQGIAVPVNEFLFSALLPQEVKATHG
ncbi:MAG: 2-dehydropantoate 2-reductase [Gammaproteobacteria bacterium]|nr:2-dehydropantoate 2-reductase [Gammaproteobacteria bacterium]